MTAQPACSRCGLLLDLTGKTPGTVVRCIGCGQRFRLPGSIGSDYVKARRLLAGRYEMRDKLGQGAFGVVYHGRDRQLGDRDVAIKMLRAEVVENRDALRRLRAEAEVMARIVHP